jgi:hypothetical protein
MSFFTMNQDAQIFNDNQESLNDEYLASKLPEIPTEAETRTATTAQPSDANIPPHTTTVTPEKEKKESLKWANPRFTMSTFQLYETKTVSSRSLCIQKKHIRPNSLT